MAISPKGNQLIDTLSPRSEVVYAEICRRFGQKNFDLLQDLLRELEAELQNNMPVNPGMHAGVGPQKTARQR